MKFFSFLFGDANARHIQGLQKIVDQVNGFEPKIQVLSDEDLRLKSNEFKDLLTRGKTLDDILPEAFAVIREVSKRVLGMRHFDVQIMGGIVLHRRGIAEMKTGEGKTLTATLSVALNALEGKGVHVVTVNDYLAKRDAVTMARVYHAMGLSVGVIQHDASFLYDPTFKRDAGPADAQSGGVSVTPVSMVEVDMDCLRPCTRMEAYRADITYGTNNEYGFDYLRDNMSFGTAQMVQRPLNYAIVDEVDSILVDEARTPLIISAPAEQAGELYGRFADIVKVLKRDVDFTVDEKMRSVSITEEGISRVEKALGVENLYVAGGIGMVHHLEAALKAEVLYVRDKDYVVKDGDVVIVDEFTGRMLPGRRYSEGLHQAIEAKEGAQVREESLTLATVTFQNYFRMYKKLAGMTGTAATEAEEFAKIYKLDVTSIPTNRVMIRRDSNDRIYKNERGKFAAVVEEIKARHAKGQPVLIGTISIAKNEYLHQLLLQQGVPHEILNAKNHEREAQIIAQAGRRGSVTLATNMAGRGVDIILGGNPQDAEEAAAVKALGGLCVIGTERHESRRIDNQLRGRAGRQGDAGESVFFVSLEDDLMRIFMSDSKRQLIHKMGLPDDMPIENPLITKIIESAQKKVEGHNFDIRKHVLEYDDVLNKHREVIYARRRLILDVAEGRVVKEDGTPRSLRDIVLEYVENELEQVVLFHTSSEIPEEWNLKEIYDVARTIFTVLPDELLTLEKIREGAPSVPEARTRIIAHLVAHANAMYDKAKERFGDSDILLAVEKEVLLRAIDTLWIEHLQAMDHLRAGIGLRGYGQHDPLVEYKRESYRMFGELLILIQRQVAYSFFKVEVSIRMAPSIIEKAMSALTGATIDGGVHDASVEAAPAPSTPAPSSPVPAAPVLEKAPAPKRQLTADDLKNIGRNDPCPCGAVDSEGHPRKFKKCHGK